MPKRKEETRYEPTEKAVVMLVELGEEIAAVQGIEVDRDDPEHVHRMIGLVMEELEDELQGGHA